MTTTADTTKKCEFCDKRGLPLMLVRDAVVPADAGAPLGPQLPIEVPAHAAHYTKRLLRSGYVNVYDEARKRWDAYFVTPDGYFFKMTVTPGVIPVKPEKPFNCPDEGHGAVAGLITVPDPKNATKVWIGFSNVIWTPAVRKQNEDPAWRKRHMVSIDVKAALAGAPVAHCRPMSQLAAVVAEYAMDKTKALESFKWNPGTFASRHGRADRVRKACDAIRPGTALIVTVPDPVGITQELALLMKRNLDYFAQDPVRKRHLAANAAIATIRTGVRERAMLMEKAGAEDLANQQMQYNWLLLMLSERARKEQEELRTTTPAEAKRAADNEWLRYTAKYDEPARKKWEEQYYESLAAYDAKWVGPLALAHANWMKSRELADYFGCNYDTGNIHSGAVYTSVFTQCAAGTQDKKACIDLYEKWIEGDVADTRNLLLRAMLLNQESLASAVAKATTVSFDLKSIPWDNLIGAFGESIEALKKDADAVIAGFIVMLGGPIASMLGKIIDGKFGVRGAIMALGMMAGHPIIKLEITDKRMNFRAMAARELISRSGLALDQKKMSAAVGAELKLQEITGVKLEGSRRTTWLVFIDKEITGMPAGLSDAEQYKWVTAHIRTADAVEKLNTQRFRTLVPKEVRFGMVGLMLQTASLMKLLADDGKALAHTAVDARARLCAGIAALAATTGDILGNAWLGAAKLKFGAGYESARLTKFLGAVKWLGVIGGLTVAGLDYYQAVQAFQEGQTGLAWLYLGSATLGIGLTITLAFPMIAGAAAIPIIGILFLLVVTIAIIIEYMKDNPIQDWLERCTWGILPLQRYKDETEEQAQFQLAIKD